MEDATARPIFVISDSTGGYCGKAVAGGLIAIFRDETQGYSKDVPLPCQNNYAHRKKYDLIIIGGSGGGLLLAPLLGRKGVRIAVLEKCTTFTCRLPKNSD